MTLDDEVAWLEEAWEPRDAPRVLNRRTLVADRDALGGPEMTKAFLDYISADADDKIVDHLIQPCAKERCGGADCLWCGGTGRRLERFETWRYPTWHALMRLSRHRDQRWGPLPRRWWHPTPAEVVLAIVAYRFDVHRFRLQYADGRLIPSELAETFLISAIRKFRSSYRRGKASALTWAQLSDDQQDRLRAA